MRNRMRIGGLAVAATLVLAACGSNSTAGGSSGSSAPAAGSSSPASSPAAGASNAASSAGGASSAGSSAAGSGAPAASAGSSSGAGLTVAGGQQLTILFGSSGDPETNALKGATAAWGTATKNTV
ncbi:MAG: hypothetical protein ACR2P2_11355, partial [Nakamurella sp.]